MRPTVSKMSENASDNWAITFGLNIPIWWDKIEGGIREARHRMAASKQQYASVRNSVYFRITDALERVTSQRELADIFRYTIIPQAQQAYEVSRAGYIAGGSDFLYVIDNWQKWLAFRIQYHRILGELERSVADLEQVLGMSLSKAGISE
jgi:cobalt-zinc-cadmium efflux system outer membrane protein